jgi:hypothetical protein
MFLSITFWLVFLYAQKVANNFSLSVISATIAIALSVLTFMGAEKLPENKKEEK